MRALLSGSPPSTTGDSYSVWYDTLDTSAQSQVSVLSNDYDWEFDPVTAVLIGTPSDGGVTLNSNGHFVYTPDSGFEGTDSFTYQAYDGTGYSSTTTVTLTVNTALTPATSLDDLPSAPHAGLGTLSVSQQTGAVQVRHAVAPGIDLVYDSSTEPAPVVAVETNFWKDSNNYNSTASVEAQLTVDSIVGSSVHYAASGNLFDGDLIRLTHQVDAGTLSTGRYEYELDAIVNFTTGSLTSSRTFTGITHIVNRGDSEFGDNWSLSILDQLFIEASGVLLVDGNNVASWFEDDNGTFVSPPGLLAHSTLVENLDDTYTLTDKYGNKSEFDATGLLTERDDRNGNSTTFEYTDGDNDSVDDEIETITDPWGREITFAWVSGLLDTVTDWASRVTDVGHDLSGRLTSIQRPDPDGAGSQTSPATAYYYDGTSSQLIKIDDALSHDTEITYDFAGRFDDATYADDNDVSIVGYQARGLIDLASGDGTTSDPGALFFPDGNVMSQALNGASTDLMGNDSVFQMDRFGYVTAWKDALGNQTDIERNANGQPTKQTDPDPAGTPPRPVTEYTYDSSGNLIEIEFPDDTLNTFEYNSSNFMTSFTDELDRETTFTYDSYGNRLTTTDPLGNETEYTYNSAGQVTNITYPDPDGAGSLVAPEIDYAYDTSGRLTQVTNPDATTVDYTWDTKNRITSVSDELDRVTSYTFDELDRMLTVTLPDPDGAGSQTAPVTTFTYDAIGNRLTVTDANSYVTTFEYSNRYRLTKATLPDPDGAGSLTSPVLEWAYDAAGRVTTATDALDNDTTYVYDALGRQTTVTMPDPDGAGSQTAPVVSYLYDELGRLTRITDALSNQTDFEYDSRGRRTKQTETDPDGAGSQTSPVTEWEYDNAGQLTKFIDALDRETVYAYDDNGNVTSVTLPDPDGAGSLTSPVHSYTYDGLNRLLTSTGPLSNVTSYEYDVTSRLVKQTEPDPDGVGSLLAPVTEWEYDDAGQLTKVIDPLDRETTHTYDNLGRLTKTTLPDPDGAGSLVAPDYEWTYDILGNVLTTTDPLGNVTSMEYDNLSRRTKLTEPDPDGAGSLAASETEWAYDANGQITSVTDGLNDVTSFTYDNLGRLTKTTLPDPDGAGSLTSPEFSTTYDAMGNVLTRVDALSKTTSYTYDDLHRLTKTTDAELGETEFGYDGVGNITSLIDPEENETTWTYDDLDRMLTETNELNDVRTRVYDAASNLTSIEDRNGRDREFTYDDLNRLTKEEWKDGATVVNTIDYTYDVASQLTNVSDDYSEYDFSYDDLGRVTEIDNDATPDIPKVVLTMAYDANSRRTSLAAEVAGTDDFLNSYTYDNIGRLTQLDQEGQTGGNSVAEKRVDFAYNELGQFTQIARYADTAGTDGVATSDYTYDDAHRLTALDHKQGATVLTDYDWTYDANGRITSVTNVDGTDDYTYDDTGQVTDVDSDYQTDETYTYDDNGNRTNTGYTTGTNNQLTSDGTYNYTYDDEGNRTKKTEIASGDYVEYDWDHRNRLTTVAFKTSGGTKTKEVTYTYDAFDRRIAKDVDSDGDGTVDSGERYAYDVLNFQQIIRGGLIDPSRAFGWLDDVVLVFDESGTFVERILHGEQVDQSLAIEDASGDVIWLLPDHLGTIRDVAEYDSVTDTTTVVNHIQYGAFGTIVNQSNSSYEPRFTFTGREWDSDAKLFYYRARWYDPTVGRFVSEDPIGFAAGDSNISRYSGNGVTLRTDPSGLDWMSAFTGSLSNTYESMTKSLAAGMVDVYNGVSGSEIDNGYLYTQAYEQGPLGQTTGTAHTIVKGSIYTGAASITGVVTLQVAAGAGISQIGYMTHQEAMLALAIATANPATEATVLASAEPAVLSLSTPLTSVTGIEMTMAATTTSSGFLPNLTATHYLVSGAATTTTTAGAAGLFNTGATLVSSGPVQTTISVAETFSTWVATISGGL